MRYWVGGLMKTSYIESSVQVEAEFSNEEMCSHDWGGGGGGGGGGEGTE